jgi:hypothetical protein
MKLVRLRFRQHRNNAAKRGIAWEISFNEWWRIWHESGRWEDRGVGFGKYCMCRIGDAGPYAPTNVFIGTQMENVACAAHDRRPLKLPRGVRRQKGKYYATKQVNRVQHHIGTFSTIEEAKAAYDSFVVSTHRVPEASQESSANERAGRA